MINDKKVIALLVFGALLVTVGFILGKSSVQKQDKEERSNTFSASISVTPSVSWPIAGLYRVAKVIDGDTIQVEINGKIETLRLIGIDAPETQDPRSLASCFGNEASSQAKAMLSDKSVRLENDPSQGERDRYSRLLRYVFLEDGTNFNKFMLSQGFAHEYTYRIPYKYQLEFKEAQNQARLQKLGLWAEDACSEDKQTQPSTFQEQNQAQDAGNYDCDCNKLCSQISTCEEAYFQLKECGCTKRDSDGDGTPCESLC